MTLSENDRFRFQRSIDLLLRCGRKIEVETRWLDLGCHQGQFVELLHEIYGLRPKGVDDWNEAQKTEDLGWDYRQGDLSMGIPFDGPFDVISAFEVLEHMIDTDAFLRSIYDKLVDGGYIVLSTPNINSLRNRVMVPFGVYPNGLEYRNLVHHVRLYNKKALKSQLETTGFKDIEISGVSFLPQRFACGGGKLSQALADALPSFCNNMIAIGRK